MKEMKEWKRGFAGGVAASVLCASLLGTAFAANYQKQATLDYTGIKLKVNGQTVTPKDANGNTVEPFAISGTTYLPVRAVGNALGLDVGWDPSTQTVILSEKTGGTGTASGTESETMAGVAAGTVIVDQNGVKVTYKGVKKSDMVVGDYDICFEIENNSGIDLCYSAEDVSLNGKAVREYITYNILSKGDTVTTAICAYKTEDAGVTAPITSAGFKLHFDRVHDDSTYFETDTISVK